MFVKNPMDVMQIAFFLRSLETNSDVSVFSIDFDKMFDSAVAFDPGLDKHSIFQEKPQFL